MVYNITKYALMFGRSKNRKARRSFILKFHACIEELQKVPKNKIEDLVEYFRITTKFIDSLTPREYGQASEGARRFISHVGRGEWNRTPVGEETKIQHVWVNPTIPWDEYLTTRSILEIISLPVKGHDWGGIAKRPLSYKEFYFETLVKPFMVDNYNHARDCYKEMTSALVTT